MDMLACRRLRNRIYFHHRVSLSSPSRAVWRRYKPHIQHRYIFIRDRMRLGCGRLVRQINHGRAIHVDERHTYLVYRPRAASLALQVTCFRPSRHRLFSWARKSQHIFFFYPSVFWYVRLRHGPWHSKMCLHSFPRPTRPCREYKDACLLQAFVSWCMPAPFCLRMSLAMPW